MKRVFIVIVAMVALSAIGAESVHFVNTSDIEKPPSIPLDRAWANVVSAALNGYVGKTGDIELLKASIDQCAEALQKSQAITPETPAPTPKSK